MKLNPRRNALASAVDRAPRSFKIPTDSQGKSLNVSEYFGTNVFSFEKTDVLSDKQKKEIHKAVVTHGTLPAELGEQVSEAIKNWALSRGATHFCHWFQPLTGSSAEKHDSFLTLDDEIPMEKLSADQLIQGEPDASSFPNGGSRSTFEARGYTLWDISSPLFILEGQSSKTLCIPTVFISYTGEALGRKTPLLRSIHRLNEVATTFFNKINKKVERVDVTLGAEQEYFLVDKSFYYARPDLVMTGRTLLGSLPPKNQQMEDHYFGNIPERVLAFMEELDMELYKLGIAAKTRHNEVAPGQFELACLYRDGNLACDQNQIVMNLINKVALKHSFISLLHEKPFAGVNGNGKHLNWSLASESGKNFLSPGKNYQENLPFLALVSIIMEAVHRRSGVIRSSIASAGNDHRLGANEAPPSILSIYLGTPLTQTLKNISEGIDNNKDVPKSLDTGAQSTLSLLQDNTDRNRTSPFAFTGDKFEFRALGGNESVGIPACILNAAVAEIFDESNKFLDAEIKKGDINTALKALISKWVKSSESIIFNGDGYSQEWVELAKKRGLLNLKNTPHSLLYFKEPNNHSFLTEQRVLYPAEIMTRYHISMEKYIKQRTIEFQTLKMMVEQFVYPSLFQYKKELSGLILEQKQFSQEPALELELYKKLTFLGESLFSQVNNLSSSLDKLNTIDDEVCAVMLGDEILPLSEEIAGLCNKIEDIVPDSHWTLPKYMEMLFTK